MLQFVELCRLCAQKKRNRVDLFENDGAETRMLIGKISFCLSVHITREDLLPKMVCNDCQRSIEQFNAFRIKCQKAEERLTKMLSLNLPSKVLVTRIKEECLETDYHENSSQQPADMNSPKQCDSLFFGNGIKPVKNVKSEFVECENDVESALAVDNESQDLIQIISQEIVNHNDVVDVKQPIIEIISENFVEDYKDRYMIQNEESPFLGIKMMQNNQFVEKNVGNEPIYGELVNLDAQQKLLDPSAVIEVKMQVNDGDCEQQQSLPVAREESTVPGVGSPPVKAKPAKKRKRKQDLVESDEEIDKKYLVLGENEECDIDMEEMDAIIRKKNDPNARFDCKKCGKSFKFLKCLKKHRALHENEPESFICDICCNANAKNYEFSNLKCLKSHIQRKHLMSRTGKFQCKLCERTLTSQGQLNAHCKKVHDNSGAACQICSKAFKNKTRLSDHLKVHKEERPYVCEQCGQSFKWNNGLKVHIQSHREEKNFLCSECGKKFSAKKNLLEHLNIHAGKRPHVCKYCNATFTQLSAYSRHLYVHNDRLKIHNCDKCDKSFSQSHLLKQHKLQHSGLRPYSCSVCYNSFKSQSDLCAHIKIHQEKQYPCNVCGRKFSRSKTLKDHMVRHTGVKHVCPAPGCGKSYTQRFPLTKHFCKSHPSLIIINRMGGRKAHLTNNNHENYSGHDSIRYDYRSRDEVFVK